MPRYNAARALRLNNYGIKTGLPANLVLIDAHSEVDAIRRQADRLYVIREGEILLESKRNMIFSPKIPD
jgi:cytosine deaminase